MLVVRVDFRKTPSSTAGIENRKATDEGMHAREHVFDRLIERVKSSFRQDPMGDHTFRRQ